MSLLRPQLLAMLLLLPQSAPAQRSREVARQLVREGLELVDQRDCSAALERFTRARAVFPTSYKIDVNLGTALECLGRLTEAADHFDRFLDRADTVADRDMVARVQKKLESLRLSVATVTVRDAEAGAAITVDGREVGRAPLPRPLHLWPGQHRLTASRGTRLASMTLVLAAGVRRTVSAAWPGTPATRGTSSVGVRPASPSRGQPRLAAPSRGKRAPPQRVEQTSRERHFGLLLGLAPAVNLDLDYRLFYCFLNGSIVFPAALRVAALSVGAGVNFSLSASRRLKLELFAHFSPRGDSVAWDMAFGVGLGLHYTFRSGFALGFKTPVVGYSWTVWTRTCKGYPYECPTLASSPSQQVGYYYISSVMGLPIISIGYRF